MAGFQATILSRVCSERRCAPYSVYWSGTAGSYASPVPLLHYYHPVVPQFA